jgi:hypothetical protein
VSDESATEPPEETEQNPLRRTLDLFVFAPLGMALTAMEDLPGLIAKGRDRVENEISNARVVGKFVVDRSVREIAQRVSGRPGEEGAEFSEAAPTDGASDAPPARASEHGAGPTTAPKPAPDPADGVLVEQALADYDTLSASQVVRRLESLGPDQLRAVHRHEASHRNRRTILNRTSQLLGDGGPTPLTAAE